MMLEVDINEADRSFFSIWRVNVRMQTFRREPVPENWWRLGGRGLLARILLDEVIPTCEPLGAKNKLVFAPGLLVGHMLSSCDRISIGAKSPLTGGIKESNAGGRTGLQLAQLGIKALIIEDQPELPGWWTLHLNADGVGFVLTDELAGLGVYDAAPNLVERYGDKAAIALIGQGGEMRLSAAGIQNLDKDRVPARIAARGGIGAVMGSKGLKAIVIDGDSGRKPPVADYEGFQAARKSYNKALLGHPQTSVYRDYSTVAMVKMCEGFGALPTRNFSTGSFEGADRISGDTMRQVMLDRSGECEVAHACMTGCTIQSSNVFCDSDGNEIVSPLEYETIGLMGSNLGIDDLDTIARMNWEVNDLGLDSIEIGAALGVAADAGLLEWGDGERAMALIRQIRADSPLGRILGSGAATTGKVFGVERVPVVKGQALSAYDPRAIKGTGVTYATSPQGGDHTCGLTIRAAIDHTNPEGQAELSRGSQINVAGYDTLGACIFASFGFAAEMENIPALLNARYGWRVDVDVLKNLGRETLKLEREFNKRAGFTAADDRLPEWMTREPLPPTNAVFDVSEEDLDSVFDW
ncbi:MAG: aldehyde ferredoxin oxidoreductase C-terminal domain-containing protein [Chloroflexota bacterium]|nr:aldehyde ferredoxin oxidoreductase C-terminal domain-containing protein [Chloroflexota bacterium]